MGPSIQGKRVNIQALVQTNLHYLKIQKKVTYTFIFMATLYIYDTYSTV